MERFSYNQVSGRVNDFYKLGDGRGFVISFLEGALYWDRVDNEIQNFTGKESREIYLSHILDDGIAAESYNLFSRLLAHWPIEVPFTIDDGSLQMLLRVAGFGKFNDGSMSSISKLTTKAKERKDHYRPSLYYSCLSLLQNVMTSDKSQAIKEGIQKKSNAILNSLVSIACNIFKDFATSKHVKKDVHVLPLVYESLHEYENNTNSLIKVYMPGAKGLEFIFDDECSTERNHDYVSIFLDEKKEKMVDVGKISGRKTSSNNWPGVGENPPLIVPDVDTCWINFVTDGSNVDW